MKIKFAVIDCSGCSECEIKRFDTYEAAKMEITRLLENDEMLGSQEYKIEKRWCSE